MNAQKFYAAFQSRSFLPQIITLLALLVIACGVISSMAQSPAKEERKIENPVQEKIPVKVKVKNENSLKDKKNKNWARELELEVKNTSNKPIYYVHVDIAMPDIIISGGKFVLMMAYGRKELSFPDEALKPDDVPILPGESVTLKIPEGQLKGYEKSRDQDKMYSDPERVEIEVNAVRTDDTYFFKSGQSVHAGPKEKSANDLVPEAPGRCKSKLSERTETDISGGSRPKEGSSGGASVSRARASVSPPSATDTAGR